MQDKILEFLGESLNMSDAMEKHLNKSSFIFSELEKHKDKVDPELKNMYDKEMIRIEKMKAELSLAKEKIKKR